MQSYLKARSCRSTILRRIDTDAHTPFPDFGGYSRGSKGRRQRRMGRVGVLQNYLLSIKLMQEGPDLRLLTSFCGLRSHQNVMWKQDPFQLKKQFQRARRKRPFEGPGDRLRYRGLTTGQIRQACVERQM
eukprot:1302975-Pleurochrysis_carterae.AAC.1